MLRWPINFLIFSVVLLLTALLVPGFELYSFGAALVSLLIIGLLNIFIRPVLSLLAFPLTVITLGVFSFVLNALLLFWAAWMVDGFVIESWASALAGAVVLSVLQLIFSTVTSGKTKFLG